MMSSRRFAEDMRRMYPEGTRIVVDMMGPDPRPVDPGTKGTVLHVDDMGTVHVAFDNGRRLGLVPGEDSFHVVRERDLEK